MSETIEFEIIAAARLKATVELSSGKIEYAGAKTLLEMNNDLSGNFFEINEESGFLEPNEPGVLALSTSFIHGLIANIHYAEKRGFMDSAKHLRRIVEELEKGFALPVEGGATPFFEPDNNTNE